MAGLFSSPKPAPFFLPAPAPTPTASVQTATPEEKQPNAREILDRLRRGRRGTIATSFRGVLQSRDEFPSRKQLLGE